MRKLPDFLLDYPVNQDHPLRRAPMTGWIALHRWLIDNKSKLDMEDYARLMVIELEWEAPRLDILVRLKSKFDIARRAREKFALGSMVK